MIKKYFDMTNRKSLLRIVTIVTLLLTFSGVSEAQEKLELWYDRPADKWEEALPVGNGRIGAMIFGNPVHEVIQLNEESIWAGSKINNNNPEALKHLKELQQALFKSRYEEAARLAEKYMIGTPPRIRSYQPLGNLLIDYSWESAPTDFRRSLDIRNGIATTSFLVNGKRFIQRVFASAPDNVIVLKLTAENGAAINASFTLSREIDAITATASDSIITLTGQIIDKEDTLKGPGGEHMKFYGELRLRQAGGKIRQENGRLVVSDSKSVTITLTAATDYNIEKLDFDRTIDPVKICREILDKAGSTPLETLAERHLTEHSAMFSRVELNLGGNVKSSMPTNKRLDLVKAGEEDNGLIALYFQYGRYLLMNSSRRPGVLPANLQGIWNKDMNAPWNSDFHTNINLQMNYWLAENCNLPETSLILARFMQEDS